MLGDSDLGNLGDLDRGDDGDLGDFARGEIDDDGDLGDFARGDIGDPGDLSRVGLNEPDDGCCFPEDFDKDVRLDVLAIRLVFFGGLRGDAAWPAGVLGLFGGDRGLAGTLTASRALLLTVRGLWRAALRALTGISQFQQLYSIQYIP